MQNDRRFYVYVHRRKSDGSVFYVGKGCGPRHKVAFGRSKWWHRTAKKHGWKSEIIAFGLTNSEAMAMEAKEIASRQSLVNLTSGGEGFEIHPDAKERMRAAKLGKRQSPEHAAKSRSAKLGKPQPQSARDATRRLKSLPIISSDGEIFPSATEAARRMSLRLGVKCSQGNISHSARYERNNAYGLSWSYDTSTVPIFRPTRYQEKAVTCVETGVTFRSVQSAKDWVVSWRGKANNQCISHAARNGSTAYGYHWQYQPADLAETEKMRRAAA